MTRRLALTRGEPFAVVERDLQNAVPLLLAILTIAVVVVSIQVWNLQRDIGPIANSSIARGIAGLGSTL